MIITATGIVSWRAHTTTTAAVAAESRKMAVILQLIGGQRHAVLIYSGRLVIYQTGVTVFHRDNQTPRRKLKLRRAEENF